MINATKNLQSPNTHTITTLGLEYKVNIIFCLAKNNGLFTGVEAHIPELG